MTRKEHKQKIREEIKKKGTANTRLCKETSWKVKTTSPQQVEEIMGFVGQYTADVIRSGTYESVKFPYLGKFAVRVKQVQKLAELGKLNKF